MNRYRVRRPPPRARGLVASGVALAALLVLGACGSSSSTPTEPLVEAIFLIDSCPHLEGQTFRALMRDSALIAEAERLIASGGQRILIGELRAGDGGFNAPWSWHLDPETLEFADATIEVCSACASAVEDDLETWLNNIGSYCPWSARVLAREQ